MMVTVIGATAATVPSTQKSSVGQVVAFVNGGFLMGFPPPLMVSSSGASPKGTDSDIICSRDDSRHRSVLPFPFPFLATSMTKKPRRGHGDLSDEQQHRRLQLQDVEEHAMAAHPPDASRRRSTFAIAAGSLAGIFSAVETATSFSSFIFGAGGEGVSGSRTKVLVEAAFAAEDAEEDSKSAPALGEAKGDSEVLFRGVVTLRQEAALPDADEDLLRFESSLRRPPCAVRHSSSRRSRQRSQGDPRWNEG